MSEHRITIRLDAVLYAQLMAQSQHGPPLAAIVRQALVDYMARQTETVASSVSLMETVADLAARLQALETQVAALADRVDPLRQPAAATAASARQPAADLAADTPAPRRGGRPASPLRGQVLALLQAHPEGLRAEEIRVYLDVRRPIGDLLAGMLRGGVITAQGRGQTRRFVVSAASAAPQEGRTER
jgi:hypothetical protein